MDNLFSLLRFAIPGALFFLQIFIFDLMFKTQSLDIYGVTAEVLILIVAGFMSSILYRLFFPVHGFNHINSINYLMDRDLIKVFNNQGQSIDNIKGVRKKRFSWNFFWNPKSYRSNFQNNQNNKINAYQILTIIWHDYKALFDSEKGSYQGNLMNSFGSAMIASATGILFTLIWLFNIWICDPDQLDCYCNKLILFFVINLLMVLFLRRTWLQTRQLYTQWIESSIISMVAKHVRETSRPIEIFFFNRK